MGKAILKVAACVLCLLVVALAVLFGVNATDEPLSAEAQVLLPLPPPAPRAQNGYLDFLGLGAPAEAQAYETGVAQLAILNQTARGDLLKPDIDPRFRECRPGEYLACDDRTMRQLIDSHAL